MAFSWQKERPKEQIPEGASFSWSNPKVAALQEDSNRRSEMNIPIKPITAFGRNIPIITKLSERFLPKSVERNSNVGLGIQTVNNLIDNVGVAYFDSVWDTYKRTPDKIKQNITEGARDIQEGTEERNRLKLYKGIAKTGIRTAGDAALAIFAPLDSLVGVLMQNSGLTELVDDAGNKIADKSGITDVPAFQRFAMTHPNAGEDFERVLNLALSKVGDGKLSPQDIAKDTQTFFNKVVETKKQTPAESPVPVKTDTFSWNAPEVVTDGLALRNVPKTSVDIQTKARERGTVISDAELPRYERMNMSEQFKNADELVKDTSRAERILRGEEALPDNLERGSIYRALEVKALEEADAPLLNRLARLGAGTDEAQALKAYDRPVDISASPVDAIVDIRNARKEAAVSREKSLDVKKEVTSIKKNTPKAKVTKETWEDFIKTLEC